MRTLATMLVAATATLLAFGVAQAQKISIETVPVGDPGNAGELSGGYYGANGPVRNCGAVAYTYNIGKYEVTAGQYTAFLNAVGGADTYGLYNTYMSDMSSGSGITRSGGGTLDQPYTYNVNADFASRPVNNVSFWDCCRFANWLCNNQPTGPQGPGTTETGAYTLGGYNGDDGRTIQRNADATWAIASEDEWYKAAYYKGGSTTAGYWDYPTGSNSVPGRDMNDISGNNANFGIGTGPIDNGKYTTLVGQFQNSPSPYGTFDQGGNVWEWNESVIYKDANAAFQDGNVLRGLRGDGAVYGNSSFMTASYRHSAEPTFESYEVGFRVVEVLEPATLSLLVLAGSTLLARRRRR